MGNKPDWLKCLVLQQSHTIVYSRLTGVRKDVSTFTKRTFSNTTAKHSIIVSHIIDSHVIDSHDISHVAVSHDISHVVVSHVVVSHVAPHVVVSHVGDVIAKDWIAIQCLAIGDSWIVFRIAEINPRFIVVI